MADVEVLYSNPWDGGWVSWPEYALAIYRRIKLARTWRYRMRRVLQVVTGKPVDPSAEHLWRKLCALSPTANPFDFGPIR